MEEQKDWLVKTSTRILGPFTLEEVKLMLFRKHISIIDEVRQPSGRWQYVREHQVLREAVAKMRYEQEMSQENTASHTQTATATATNTATIPMGTSVSGLTRTVEIVQTQDLTPTPILKANTTAPIAESNIKDITPISETKSSTSPSVKSSNSGASSYGAHFDQRIQEDIENQSRRWKISLFLFAGLIFLGILGSQYISMQKTNNLFKKYVDGIVHYKSVKLYDKALQSFNQARQLKEVPDDAKKEIAPLLIAFDHQTSEGRKYLEKSLNDGLASRQSMPDIYNSIGLSYLQEGDLAAAEESLNKALGYDAQNFYAQINLSIVKYRKNQIKDTNKLTEELKQKTSEISYLYLLRSILYIDKSKVAADENQNKVMASDLKYIVSRTTEMRAELLLLQAYHEALAKNFDSSKKTVDILLEQIPKESKNYVRSPMLDWKLLEWESLDKYCSDLYRMLGPSPHTKSMRAFCLLSAGRDSEALQFINEASKEAQNDPVVLSTQLEIYYLSQHGQESEVMLRMPVLDNTIAKFYILGNVCLNNKPQNFNCAESSFNSLKGHLPKDPMSYYYLAKTAYMKNDKKESLQYIKEGLNYSENYTPLLELRDLIEAE